MGLGITGWFASQDPAINSAVKKSLHTPIDTSPEAEKVAQFVDAFAEGLIANAQYAKELGLSVPVPNQPQSTKSR